MSYRRYSFSSPSYGGTSYSAGSSGGGYGGGSSLGRSYGGYGSSDTSRYGSTLSLASSGSGGSSRYGGGSSYGDTGKSWRSGSVSSLDRSLSFANHNRGNVSSARDKFERASSVTSDRFGSSSYGTKTSGYTSDVGRSYGSRDRASSVSRDYSRAGSISRDLGSSSTSRYSSRDYSSDYTRPGRDYTTPSRDYTTPSRDYTRSTSSDYSTPKRSTTDYSRTTSSDYSKPKRDSGGSYTSSSAYQEARKARESNLTPFESRRSRQSDVNLTPFAQRHSKTGLALPETKDYERSGSRESLSRATSRESVAHRGEGDSSEGIDSDKVDTDDEDFEYKTSRGTSPMREKETRRERERREKLEGGKRTIAKTKIKKHPRKVYKLKRDRPKTEAVSCEAEGDEIDREIRRAQRDKSYGGYSGRFSAGGSGYSSRNYGGSAYKGNSYSPSYKSSGYGSSYGSKKDDEDKTKQTSYEPPSRRRFGKKDEDDDKEEGGEAKKQSSFLARRRNKEVAPLTTENLSLKDSLDKVRSWKQQLSDNPPDSPMSGLSPGERIRRHGLSPACRSSSPCYSPNRGPLFRGANDDLTPSHTPPASPRIFPGKSTDSLGSFGDTSSIGTDDTSMSRAQSMMSLDTIGGSFPRRKPAKTSNKLLQQSRSMDSLALSTTSLPDLVPESARQGRVFISGLTDIDSLLEFTETEDDADGGGEKGTKKKKKKKKLAKSMSTLTPLTEEPKKRRKRRPVIKMPKERTEEERRKFVYIGDWKNIDELIYDEHEVKLFKVMGSQSERNKLSLEMPQSPDPLNCSSESLLDTPVPDTPDPILTPMSPLLCSPGKPGTPTSPRLTVSMDRLDSAGQAPDLLSTSSTKKKKVPTATLR